MGDIYNNIYNISQKALEFGKSFSVNLDFSENSLKDVDEILEHYHKDLKGNPLKNAVQNILKEKPTESQVWSMATIWGIYIGEVIRKNNPQRCEWVIEDVFGDRAVLHLKTYDNGHIFPIDKAYKRLRNGKEDDILCYYELIREKAL